MPEENLFSPDPFVQEKVEDIWRTTCGTWKNCSESNIQELLLKCEEQGIDPQYCMSWVEEHSGNIPNWDGVSDAARQWVNNHTSTGSPIVSSDLSD
ncbi:hypothetical protein [Bacillus sp. V5-8f]|uniref:hypothetical protein n=1 Tax=Bacillus sp. V5-8f TaxID=2053044 RepID=UPI000C77BFDB|nr:hypothetical protein [Bacillus sp. V5-8f]PLT35600.1 hypothetical protein CUU64_03060 [Bacillus sp. V5-8f]